MYIIMCVQVIMQQYSTYMYMYMYMTSSLMCNKYVLEVHCTYSSIEYEHSTGTGDGEVQQVDTGGPEQSGQHT